MRLILFGGTFLEKCGKIWKNGHFSGRLWPDWGNTTRAAMAGSGSIGKSNHFCIYNYVLMVVLYLKNNQLLFLWNNLEDNRTSFSDFMIMQFMYYL